MKKYKPLPKKGKATGPIPPVKKTLKPITKKSEKAEEAAERKGKKKS